MDAKFKVKVEITSQFVSYSSENDQDEYVFSYTAIITNQTYTTIRLLKRDLKITNGDNEVFRLDGNGVLGQRPYIGPSESFSYSGGVIIETPVGLVEGIYTMVTQEGDSFEVVIPEFRVAVPNSIH